MVDWELWKGLGRHRKALIIPLNPPLEKGDLRWVPTVYQLLIFKYPPFLKRGRGDYKTFHPGEY
jgi:hypothetical protein